MAGRAFPPLQEPFNRGPGRTRSQRSFLQPPFIEPPKPGPRRDRYRASRHEPQFDLVEDEDAALDSLDESLVQAPYEDRQSQAARGQARLSFAPATSLFNAPPVAFSKPQQYETESYATDAQLEISLQNPQPRFSRFAFGTTQPEESSSDAHMGASSSPAFKASQRRVVNSHMHAIPPTGIFHTQETRLPLPDTYRPHDTPHTSTQEPFPLPERDIVGKNSAPIIQGIPLVPLGQLPDRFRTIFPFPAFNAVQSKCFDAIFSTDDNFVLASPTGSGKTAILELAICRAIAISATGQYKIVYQAPTKALCDERQRDWKKKLDSLGLKCVTVTGDSDFADLRAVQSANLIITTPEKWDTVTRKWKDHSKLMQLIRLFLIDEVHILKEDRGATLEAVVSRMKSIGTNVRFVALSATVPNFGDVAAWLGRNSLDSNTPALSEKFGEDFRPVKLRKYVCGFNWGGNEYAFDKMLDVQLPQVIQKHSENKPIMIFCFTRKSTVNTARRLAAWWNARQHERPWDPPTKPLQFYDRELRECGAAGVAFHHAGLDLSDRLGVEKAFLTGDISVICCTSTLAVGVNLPCHLVIIKNTVTFAQEVVQEYSDTEVMQMLGRAGRPQFDDSAVAVIMTRQSKVRKYELMATGQDTLESTLHLNLIDHLNAEISLGTIRDITSARGWLASTFLYVRLKQNPAYYKIERGQSIDEQLDSLCSSDISLLRDNNLITGEERFQSTEFGYIMAKYCVHFHSMRVLMGLQTKASISEILSAIAQASEFENIRFRAGEKVLYKSINQSPYIRFPIPVNLDLPAHKVSLLIQSTLGGADILWDGENSKHRTQYYIDVAFIFKHILRLIRCVVDCQIHLGDSVSISNALILGRSFSARVWDESALQMKQIDGLGVVAVRKLANAGIRSLEELECTDALRIDTILGRNPPFGFKILENLKGFPKLRVSLNVLPLSTSQTSEGVTITVKADVGFINEKPPEMFASKAIYVCLLAETSDGRKAHFARISSKKLGNGQVLSFPVLLKRPGLSINCYIMCDSIAGTMRSATVVPKVATHMFPVTRPAEPAPDGRLQRPTSNISKPRAQTAPEIQKPISIADEFGDGGIDDDDLVQASLHDLDFDHIDNYSNPVNSLTRKNTADNTASKGKERLKVGRDMTGEGECEPRQLENGKWACNHRCKDKKGCRHLCCKEGLDKLPKKSATKNTSRGENRSGGSSMGSETTKRKTQTKLQLTTSKRKSSASIEELDLTQEKRKKADCANNGPKDYHNLHKLHQSILAKDHPASVSSIMRQKPSYCYGNGGGPDVSFLGFTSSGNRGYALIPELVDTQPEEAAQLEASYTQLTSSKDTDEEMLDDYMYTQSHTDMFDDDDSMFEEALAYTAEMQETDTAGIIEDHSLVAVNSPETKLNVWPSGFNSITTGYVKEPMPQNSPSPDQHITARLLTQKLPLPRMDDTCSPTLSSNDSNSADIMLGETALAERKSPNNIPYPARESNQGTLGEAPPSQNKENVVAKDPELDAPLLNGEDGIAANDEEVPDPYKDLEPWLFREFGGIVEIVD